MRAGRPHVRSRNSTRASSRISTSSPRRRTRASTFPTSYWGCDGGPSDRVATITQKPYLRPTHQACFDYRTLGDELDTAGLTWRFYTSTIQQAMAANGRATRPLSTSRDGPDWQKDVITPQRQFITDIEAGTLAKRHVDHADLHRLRPRQLRRRLRPVVGHLARQRGRRKQVLEFNRDLRHVGRLGRSLRPRAAAAQRLRRPGVPRSAARHLRRTRRKTTSRTSSTKPAASCALPKTSSVCRSLAAADARATSPAGDCFDFMPAAAQVRADQGTSERRVLSAASPTTATFPTNNEARDLRSACRDSERLFARSHAASELDVDPRRPRAAPSAVSRQRRGQDQAHRLHRPGEPELRQSLSGLSRRRYGFERQEFDRAHDQA